MVSTVLLNVDNIYMEQIINQIYPTELQLHKAPFLDLISNGIFSSNSYDTRDNFDLTLLIFRILIMMFLDLSHMCIRISAYSLFKGIFFSSSSSLSDC